ncbi:MAG: hypothetical protein V4684_02630 [Pseudomonadota bacterium]
MSLKAALLVATRVAEVIENEGSDRVIHEVRQISWLGDALVSLSAERGQTFQFNPMQQISLRGGEISLLDMHGHAFTIVLVCDLPSCTSCEEDKLQTFIARGLLVDLGQLNRA